MKIRIVNHTNASQVSQAVILVRGCVENYSAEVWRKHSRSTFLVMIHTRAEDKNANEPGKLISEVPMVKLRFKVLVQLHPGDNEIVFDFLGVKDTLRISFNQVSSPFTVRLVYVVCRDDDGRFQSPPDTDNSVEAAVRRIRVAGLVIQCALAEMLWTQRLGRKTFRLETEPGSAEPRVHILHSQLSRAETHAMEAERLWQSLARELVTSEAIGDKRAKYLAWLSSTEYHNPRGRRPMSHAETLAMTRAHIALGGGGLGLFGTGCLWTWPSSVTSVQSRLCDQTQVDSTRLMDDSGYRGTVGGCVATTLGSVLHELGHTFDLGHTEAGIMARGFDDLDSLLTVMSERGGTRHLTSGRGQLTPCGQASRGPSPVPSSASILRSNSLSSSGGQSPRFTSIRRSDSVSKYLEEYSEKRAERRVETESQGDGGCHWTRSCALLLAHQPWIRDHPGSLCPGEIQMSRHQITACCRLAVVELRGKKGMVLSFWTPDPGSEEDAGDLELAGEMTVSVEHLDIVAMAACGKIRKLGL